MSTHDQTSALLEVVVLHPRDAQAATAGGADRLLLLTDPAAGGRAPAPAAVSAVVRETDLPVRVLLRVDEGLGATPAQFDRLAELAGVFTELGAAGFSFGFLDRDLEIDRPTCAQLAARTGGSPWGFHRGFDDVLQPDRAWRDVAELPALDAVASAGSTRGFSVGGDGLIARAGEDPTVARLLLVSGGLTTEEVPWLVRAGVRKFGLAEEVRPDRSWDKASVDPEFVRAWRMLLDDSLDRLVGE